MIIAIYLAVVVIASGGFWFFSQYTDSSLFILLYLMVILASSIALLLAERAKRKRLVDRAIALFDGQFSEILAEDELSALERRILREAKNTAATDERIKTSYQNIAALVSDIAHQCKTPLSSVLLYSELPASDDNSASIHRQAKKLAFLLDALTKLSRCEGGLISANLHPACYPVEQLVCEALNGAISAARQKHIDLRCTLPEGLTVQCDLRWTAEAIFNLIDNAVKYSPPDSIVTVSAHAYDLFVRIDVTDQGVGIPDDEQVAIWKRFYRGKAVETTAGGVGIGLYLTRLILTAEGGRAAVESGSDGSTFSVFLPRR